MAAALQHLDLDIFWEQWSPPPTLIDKSRLKGVPQHGIGRPCKVGKEQIIGLLTALELFVAEGDAVRHRRWRGMMETLANGLQGVPGEVALHGIESAEEVPVVTLTLARGSRLSALDLVIALQNGSPSIQIDPLLCEQGTVTFNPMCLQSGEAEIVAASVRQLLIS
jgi:L-seryl-tRNA(Ser) seleniumtransferase